jgi:hypothetical protein
LRSSQFKASLGKKSETPFSTNKLGMVVLGYGPSCVRGIGKEDLGQKHETLSEK